jgi:hypothetical protein
LYFYAPEVKREINDYIARIKSSKLEQGL